MKQETYNRLHFCLVLLFVMVAVGAPAAVFVAVRDWRAAAITFCGCLLLCVAARLLHRLDDKYITGVVADLSLLIDVLVELEEKEVFPEGEDTFVSKLQNKVIKLVRILKNKNQAAEAEQESIKQMVSDLSHQLKTPISNLKMYSQFLKDDSLPPETRRQYVEILGASVERLNFLSENMIKISRLESGLIQLKMHRQELGETALKALKDIYPKAKQKGLRIEYREEQEIFISHDRNWTAEAIYNLLDNAVKYAQGDGKVILSLRKLGMFAEVSVEDENGTIPESERTKIFTRFYRGKNSYRQEGIGVGLYLSREIAVKQGGYINLKPTGKGNIFSLLLFLRRQSEDGANSFAPSGRSRQPGQSHEA